jgi:hypothetical protein
MKNLRNELKELMKASHALLMFPAELRGTLERELLVLPENDIKDLIVVFGKEKEEIKKTGDRAVADAAKFKKLTTDVVMAGQGLKKALIRSREYDAKRKDQQVTDNLLNDLDSV